MEFWLAVTPMLSCAIAHSTAGQCNVVKRAPMPSVLRPSCSVALGKIVDCGLCAWMRFFNRRRLAKVAGKIAAPSASAKPSASVLTGAAPVRASRRHAQSPVAESSSNTQLPAAVSKRLCGHPWIGCAFWIALRNAGQSRQKSGDTHGLVAMRRLFCRRNVLMADMGI